MGNHINPSQKLSFPGQIAQDFAFHCCCCSHTREEMGKTKEREENSDTHTHSHILSQHLALGGLPLPASPRGASPLRLGAVPGKRQRGNTSPLCH